ncbi:MAG: MbnP family protein [Bacteroidia bacterium]
MKSKSPSIVILLLAVFNTYQAQLKINIETVFANNPLLLNRQVYTNNNGDTLSVESFKFYLSNFSVHSKGKWRKIKDTYFLVDAENESSKCFNLACNESEIDSIYFYIGVDSIMNVSGALEGALDPSLGMYWAWNTGYINAKLEGKSNSCKTIHHVYEFHIGGYLKPFNALKKVSLKTKGNKNGITLLADASKWFYGAKQINLKEFNSVVTPSNYSLMVADNYKDMFSVK